MRYLICLLSFLASGAVWSQPKFFIGMSIDSAESIIGLRYPELPLAGTPPSDSTDASYTLHIGPTYGSITIADRFAPTVFDSRRMSIEFTFIDKSLVSADVTLFDMKMIEATTIPHEHYIDTTGNRILRDYIVAAFDSSCSPIEGYFFHITESNVWTYNPSCDFYGKWHDDWYLRKRFIVSVRPPQTTSNASRHNSQLKHYSLPPPNMYDGVPTEVNVITCSCHNCGEEDFPVDEMAALSKGRHQKRK